MRKRSITCASIAMLVSAPALAQDLVKIQCNLNIMEVVNDRTTYNYPVSIVATLDVKNKSLTYTSSDPEVMPSELNNPVPLVVEDGFYKFYQYTINRVTGDFSGNYYHEHSGRTVEKTYSGTCQPFSGPKF